MNSKFKSRQLSFLILITVATLILFGIHSYLVMHFAPDTKFFFPLWQVYVFHFVVTLALYTLINYLSSIGKTNIFNPFMLGTMLKMFLAIVFLLPLILSKGENKQPDVFNFFIPYFLYLFLEVFSLTKFLQKTP